LAQDALLPQTPIQVKRVRLVLALYGPSHGLAASGSPTGCAN
jgi:hypothetical protein